MKSFVISAMFVALHLCAAQKFPEAGVHFPSDNSENKNKEALQSTICGENELLYPGDHANDYVCDCKKLYLYYPLTAKCYEAYSRGPCKNQQILILPPKPRASSIPVCTDNPCKLTGEVKYNGTCYPLLHETNSPCLKKNGTQLKQYLQIHPKTTEIVCAAKNIVDSRVGGTEEGNSEEEEDAKEAAKYGKGCPEGAKRQQEAKCETDVVNPEED